MEGFQHRYINNVDALPHHGLKIVINHAKRPILSDIRIIEYISTVFAVRIARGLKLYVNNIQVHKPDGFDSKQYELFRLQDPLGNSVPETYRFKARSPNNTI